MDSSTFTYVVTEFGVVGLVVVAFAIAILRLSSDLAKLRTDLQQQVARDLLNKRFDAYGELWSKLQPLAIYTDDPLSPSKAGQLSEALSRWYFSAAGGMFLTVRARDFYFALQDTLQAAAELHGWKCTRRPAEPKEKFRGFLAEALAGTEFATFNPAALDHPERMDAATWRSVCKSAAKRLLSLPTTGGVEISDTMFATVQQVSSALRTVLADELHSRLELNIPRP